MSKREPSGPNKPTSTDVAIQKAVSFATAELGAMRLQSKRLQAATAGTDDVSSQSWSDAQFFLVALTRFKHSVQVATSFDGFIPSSELFEAQRELDASAPELKLMRDVGEHLEDYAAGSGRKDEARDDEIHTAVVTAHSFNWIGREVKFRAAISAAEKVIQALLQLHTIPSSSFLVGVTLVTGSEPDFTHTHSIGSRG